MSKGFRLNLRYVKLSVYKLSLLNIRLKIGTILPSPSAFGGPSADNLPRTARKRTIVDELVDDAEARRYAKKKFLELQTVKGSRGRGTLAKKLGPRKPKW